MEIVPKAFLCKACDESIIVPAHCGQPMRLTEEDNNEFWICWKGEHEPCCGRESIIEHESCCEKPSLQAGNNIKPEKVLL